MTSPTPYQLLPRLTDDEYEALKADIAENGVRVPIDVDEDGVILDGHHRAWITADLGVECPRRTLVGLSDEGKRAHAVAVNVHRRSLNREQRRELVARLRNDGMSLRAISAATGISPATAMRDTRVSDETPAEITGLDGRSYAATRPPAAPEPVDEFSGGEWAEPDADAYAGPSHVLDHADLETATPSVAVRSPEPEPKPKRRPLPEAFTEASLDLAKTAERLVRLTQDDRFTRNREQAHHQMPSLITALEHTAALVEAMRLDETAASEEARRWWATSLNTISDTLAGVAQTITKEQ